MAFYHRLPAPSFLAGGARDCDLAILLGRAFCANALSNRVPAFFSGGEDAVLRLLQASFFASSRCRRLARARLFAGFQLGRKLADGTVRNKRWRDVRT